MKQYQYCAIQCGAICWVKYCDPKVQRIEENHLAPFTHCQCKFALIVFMWISTWFILRLAIRRRLISPREDNMLITLAFIHNIVFFVPSFVVAEAWFIVGISLAPWQCLTLWALAIWWWNLCGFLTLVASLVPPTNPGHVNDLNLRRRQG